jgi:hypothetical protein
LRFVNWDADGPLSRGKLGLSPQTTLRTEALATYQS